MDLAQCCDAWAGSPLLFQPGTEWNYSVATDVLGRVVEVASGQRLDEFMSGRIFGPLGMTDTGVLGRRGDRAGWPRCTRPAAGRAGRAGWTRWAGWRHRPPRMLSGGGGLISTAADYHRFTQMLLDRPGSPGGELDGVRLLGPRTVAYMTRNHLPGGADLETFGRPLYAEAPFARRRLRPRASPWSSTRPPGKMLGSAGEYSWGGAASTAFWVDPAEELTVCFFTQLCRRARYPIRSPAAPAGLPGAGGVGALDVRVLALWRRVPRPPPS